MKDFGRGECKTVISYGLRFFCDETGGYEFDCDENGTPIFDLYGSEYVECKKRNYEKCMAHPEQFEVWNVVHKYEKSVREPNSGVCACGNRIDLWDQYLGACECPHCGRWWNMWGQELNNPSTWSSGEDWCD